MKPIITTDLPQAYYRHTNFSGQTISVIITEDCGIVNGKKAQWHKVLCKPIGFNNSPTLALDFNELTLETA